MVLLELYCVWGEVEGYVQESEGEDQDDGEFGAGVHF